MKPSRDLDKLVAEKVLGARVWEVDGELVLRRHAPWGPLPHYSTRIEDAWQVVEKLNLIVGPHYRPGWYSPDEPSPVDGWNVYADYMSLSDDTWSDDSDKHALAVAETAPLAICLAALKTVGVEVEATT